MDQREDLALFLFRAFAPGGSLSQVLPGYKMREGQLRLAQSVGRALLDQTDLVAEGPVGLGKSLAYALPLAYFAERGDQRRGLIVTANIALQEQLINKDLPIIKKILPSNFTFGLVKGRGNYLCLNELEELKMGNVHGKTQLRVLDDNDGIDHHMRIAAWATTTKTGDRSELQFEPSSKTWSRFSVSAEGCIGPSCPHSSACFSNKAREEVTDNADVIVTNYHMFFAMLSRLESGGIGSLPDCSYLVLDEAHQAADIAQEFFGFRISEGSIRWLTSRIREDPGVRLGLEKSAMRFFSLLRNARPQKGSGRLIAPLPEDWAAPLLRALADVRWYFQEREDRFDQAAGDGTKAGKMAAMARMAKEATDTLRQNVQSASALRDAFPEGVDEDKYVYSIEEDRGQILLRARRLRGIRKDSKGEVLIGRLQVRSRVLISATMTVGGSFGPVIRGLADTVPELGLDVGPRTFVAESPFHWVSQAKLVIPENVLPSPRDRGFQAALGQALGYIIGQAKGRTLCLFTSWASLEAAYASLRGKTPYTLLKQGDLPRSQLIEVFKRDTHSVLLGVESFWAGIDVPGESLSCVVIDKLPFPNINDPILEALEDDGDCFEKHSIPRMILQMRQGFGRLIRAVSDRGVVVVLDNRVHGKWQQYGKLLVHSLPPVPLSLDLDDVGKFLK